MAMDRKRVIVGMSGGVDSSVAALLLLRQGYEVVGATFRLWAPCADSGLAESACCAADDVHDARRVCELLGIPHYVFNYKDLFRTEVVDYFVAEYRRGATPNPCIACNRRVKFDSFIRRALGMEFDYVATGHYALVEFDPARNRHRLRRGSYAEKDQSYVLYTLTRQQLAHVLMPLGGYRKAEIRALAREAGLPVSGKADSQDICFVPDGDYGAFLEAYTGESPPSGNFVDEQGRVLGRHQGLWRYTVGQRKGLGVSFGRPMYVSAIDPVSGNVTLSAGDALFSRELTAEDVNLLDLDRLDAPLRCTAKIRYSARPAPAEISPLEGGGIRIVFDEPQRAVTPGQAVVFYDGDYVLGGATICRP